MQVAIEHQFHGKVEKLHLLGAPFWDVDREIPRGLCGMLFALETPLANPLRWLAKEERRCKECEDADVMQRALETEPDLLEAAREALSVLSGFHQNLRDYPLPSDRQLPRTIKRLQEAIAKAEGKEARDA